MFEEALGTTGTDTLDAELAELGKELEKPSAPAEGAAPAPQSGDGTGSAPAASPEPVDELEERLKGISEEEPKPEEAKPALTTEQQEVLRIIPTAREAQDLMVEVGGYRRFSDTLTSGDYAGTLRMIDEFGKNSGNPGMLDGLLEQIYREKVGSVDKNGTPNGEWVERWLADQEGNPTVNRGLSSMQRKIAELEAKLANRSNSEQQAQSKQRNDQIMQGYVSHVTKLFDIAQTPKEDRKYIMAAVSNAVAGDERVKSSVMGGNYASVNKIVKNEIRSFNKRSQTAEAAAGEQQTIQAKHKPPLQSGGITPEGSLPDNIKDVPKGKEDTWMDEQLAKLGRKKK